MKNDGRIWMLFRNMKLNEETAIRIKNGLEGVETGGREPWAQNCYFSWA